MPNRLLHGGWHDPETRHIVWARVSEWVVFIAIVVAVFFGSYGLYAVHETNQIVVSHNTELAQTRRLAEQNKELANQILAFEKQSNTNHSSTLQYLEAICASSPNCVNELQNVSG